MNIKEKRRKKIHLGIRKKISGTALKPRLSVFRSNTNIYVQAVDDISGATLAASSTRTLNTEKKGIEAAKEVGKDIGNQLLNKKIETAVFDRSGYLYHGRVKALAEGAREAGLKF
ncbi:MAG TPA: 50S ribosomal protein L18 [Saprospiraceae bacterium]|nr:50S ribosomal protein L18 [Saprospiraceae bacterium]